ncbi:MAG: TIGR02281 family clan AA aspartic protease [Sphingomonadales bacterium]|nr:TIGR02281 family clan AA aspartic protease [Sphingomonadales bacterium]
MNRLYAILLLSVGLMSFVAVLFQPPEDHVAMAAESAEVQDARPMARHDEGDALLLKRDDSGQFHLTASVNGGDVRFLVDTGADMVALTEDTAEELGLTVGEMQPIMQTASGVGYAAPVVIDEMVVAGVTMTNIDAVVAQGLSTNLLGQSVLGKLGSVNLQGDQMVIRPR